MIFDVLVMYENEQCSSLFWSNDKEITFVIKLKIPLTKWMPMLLHTQILYLHTNIWSKAFHKIPK